MSWKDGLDKKEIRGIHRIKRSHGYKFVAEISVNKERHHLGTFDTLEAAQKARKSAEKKLLPTRKRSHRKPTIDLTGKRFGLLTVIGLAPRKADSREITWRCLCDCGKEVIQPTRRLNYGEATSCGDRRRHPQNKGSEDLTGRQFGHLTVLKLIPSKKGEKSTWLCQCDCGKQVKVMYNKLISGRQTSCGHVRKSEENINKLNKAFNEKLFVDGVAVGMIDSDLRKVSKRNTVGMNGISKVERVSGTKYLAQITINHVRTRLGYFDTFEEAKQVRLQAERDMLPKH